MALELHSNVKGGRIDHGLHAVNAYSALEEARQMHMAVARALELVDTEETLVVVMEEFKTNT